uniref:Protein SQS1 n=1 Tax=Kwoniella bestiolae CBS 10118 TaxID=1296100 RepID=A0A1B9GAZ8_9TREE|nr:hypothetical protein I302_03051 [Kwoniella bestiolae CBS 10118]OCF28199.1 hypothetical protein I302_03051 [Kwoniella bestiolae CBS 10118]
MVQRQSFGDFLNSGSPSTPRGRGRGGFRGGGGRGGRGGGFTPGSNKKSFNADYTNMGFDYEKINSQRYTKMGGFNVQPFGPSPAGSPGPSTPSGRGSQTPRGRGRGSQPYNRGRHHNPSTPSGSATSVHGLGFHDTEADTRAKGDHRGLGSGKSTVGKGIGTGTITWGGGNAPLFVKAGELFKEGEADVITMGKDHKLHVEVFPMSHPSAPQMTHLQDQTEVDIIQQPSPLSPPTSSPPTSEAEEPAFTIKQDEGLLHYQDDALEELLGSTSKSTLSGDAASREPIPLSEPAIADDTDMVEITERIAIEAALPGEVSNAEEMGIASQRKQDAVAEPAEEQVEGEMVDEEIPLFFVDTEPDTISETPAPTYDITQSLPLGQQAISAPEVESEEEKILFVPKTYKKPEPVFINIGTSPQSERKSKAPDPPTRAFVNPRALSRAEKKAAKREKRSGRGKKSRRRKQDKVPRDDSDLDWGSDGPPVNLINVEGGESDSFADGAGNEEDEDIKILRDYMQGTMLNAQTERAEHMDYQMEGDEEGVDDDEDAEEMDLEAMRLFGQGIKGLTEGGQEIVDEEDWQSDESRDEENEDGEEEEEEEDDDDDDDDSSVLGEIDIEGMMDDDSDEEDIDALFNGSGQWDKDTDWFINAMEDALDGTDVNMRDRKSLSLNPFLDSSLTTFAAPPVKKGKKNKFVPQELQAQWEKDRLVKAEKKQQRELERLIAEIEPTLAGYSRKGKAKAKGKGKAHQASVAHLIPASASQVADLFDISSDEEGELSLPVFRKGGRLPSGMPLEMIDERIQIFLDHRGKTTLQLPPMGKDDRKKVHMLADCYNLGSKSRGSGKTRFTVLTKNKRSGTLVDQIKIERLISASQKVGGSFYKALYTRGGKAKVKGQSGGPSIRHKEGDMVGHGADKIGEDNVGHRLLSKMGWAEGGRIGRGAGLEAP